MKFLIIIEIEASLRKLWVGCNYVFCSMRKICSQQCNHKNYITINKCKSEQSSFTVS